MGPRRIHAAHAAGDCTGGHEAMFQLTTTGSPIKYFLEPTALSLNYLKSRSRSITSQPTAPFI